MPSLTQQVQPVRWIPIESQRSTCTSNMCSILCSMATALSQPRICRRSGFRKASMRPMRTNERSGRCATACAVPEDLSMGSPSEEALLRERCREFRRVRREGRIRCEVEDGRCWLRRSLELHARRMGQLQEVVFPRAYAHANEQGRCQAPVYAVHPSLRRAS